MWPGLHARGTVSRVRRAAPAGRPSAAVRRVHGVQAPSALARSAHLLSWARSVVLCSFIGADIAAAERLLCALAAWPKVGPLGGVRRRTLDAKDRRRGEKEEGARTSGGCREAGNETGAVLAPLRRPTRRYKPAGPLAGAAA